MPSKRTSHGCGRVTKNNTDYMILLGGTDGNVVNKDILYYNISQKLWETTNLNLPEGMAEIKGVISFQLDTNGCKIMILGRWPVNKLYICDGNYAWKWLNATRTYDQWNKFAVVGANELLPCGID